MYSDNHNLVLEYLHHPKKFLCASLQAVPFQPTASDKRLVCVFYIHLPFLDISYKRYYLVCNILYLASDTVKLMHYLC